MPPNKNKLLRMGVIVEMLRKGAYPNYNRFLNEMRRRDPAGTYSISERTFRRDIEDLKEEYDAPIEYDASSYGFYLRDLEWFNQNLMVEPFEMKGVLLGQKVAKSLMPEPLRSSIEKAVRSLLTHNSSGFGEMAEVEMMQIINPIQLPLSPEIFCTVFEAWEQRQRLLLNYNSLKGPPKDMLFEPHIIAWQGGVWYLKGLLCGTEKYEYRKPYDTILAVHRIQSAEKLTASFQGSQKLLDSVRDGKLFDFSRFPEVQLLFLPIFARLIKERFCEEKDCIKEDTDGSLLLTVKDWAEHEVLDLIFLVRGQVKVVAPETLRQKVIDLAESILENQSQS